MAEFFLSFFILLAVVLAMAVGVMRGRAPISGSCGGLNRAGVGGGCELCGGDTRKCEEISKDNKPQSNDVFYDAS
jgi:hypothetical protein